MEVLIPPPPPSMDFDFNSARSSPHTSAPSTPKRFGEYFFSAPTSPARMANFYREFEEFDEFGAETPDNNRSPSTTANVPFDWEEKPGTPKSPEGRTKKIAAKNMYENEEDGEDDLFDFAFDLRKADLERDSHSHRSAEELFDGGKIRPLRPPPRLHDQHATATLTATTTPKSPLLSPRSPKSQQQNSYYRGMFSPRRPKIENVDPFKVAVENSKKTAEQQRGRERLQGRSNSGRRATRSHSPYRVSAYRWEEEEQREEKQVSTAKQTTLSSSKSSFFTNFSSSLASASKGSSKRWRLKDLLLFRSASEGRATDKKDPLRKYSATAMFRKQEEAAAATNASFRSGDCPASSSSSSGSISKRRSRGGPVSAHELHYTVNRAVSEDLKKKTFLPYKQGILGRLAFNPAVHALANGFGSLYR